MKVAIIHNHLNRGGVTQVIANHLRALNEQVPRGARLPVAVLYGGRCEGWPIELTNDLQRLDVSLHTVGELDYDNVRPHAASLERQLRSVLQQAGFATDDTVLHAHNHSLGKNVQLPRALQNLTREGYAALLQIHDFAEDFRPDNYRALGSVLGEDKLAELPGLLYSQAPQIHYAVLNGRDHAILLAAGVENSRLHLLPNPVASLGSLPPRDAARAKLADRFGIPEDHRFILYPVRGIRRKNLGEALLWSALADANISFGLTLPPFNPLEQPSYARWKELASQLELPWAFEVGGPDGLSFGENLSAADLILTTSVAEGFGLVFLEAWLAGKDLIGRDLPEITKDFRAAGIRFAGLQPQLWIPIDWLDEEGFRQRITSDYQNVLAAYGEPKPSSELLSRNVDALVHDGLLDFGSCGTSLQRQVIQRVTSDVNACGRLLEINPWIGNSLAMRNADPSRVAHNAQTVHTEYSLSSCGHRLLALYQRILSSARHDALQPPAHGERVLESFLDLSRFHPLRIES